ncbi:MAG: aminotransferase class V-fold PLP-dependent enzyme [Acidobacteriota bacterium]|nr:aminotransferase class V-fold PLP-dependent enzyme [Acidobacteriota bacterium]
MPTTTLAQFRSRFPILGRRIYVNSCSQGALSLEVEAALGAFTESWHAHGSPWDRWVGEVERLRSVFATAIGADEDEIAVMPNASTAIAAIATALAFDTDRRAVVLGAFEFPTMAHVWLAQQRRGARIVRVDAVGEALPIQQYAARVDQTTLVVPATHVCFRNGYRLDIPRLAALCRERGAYCMLDDYQRTGTAPLDVHALGVDFMVTGALKYLLGPAGVAFLYVRRALIERLEPLVTGWFGRVDPFAFSIDRLDWAPSARRFETGSPPVPNVYAAAAGIELLRTVSPGAIEAQIARVVERFVSGAQARGFETVTPDTPAERGPLVVVRSTDAAALALRLQGRGIIASSRGTGLRVSFHAYNTDEDADAVLEGLDAEEALVSRNSRPSAQRESSSEERDRHGEQ